MYYTEYMQYCHYPLKYTLAISALKLHLLSLGIGFQNLIFMVSLQQKKLTFCLLIFHFIKKDFPYSKCFV